MYEGIWVEGKRQKNVRVFLHWWKNAWKTEIPPKGYVWIVHGMGEHGARYSELATYLTGFGFDVLAPDLPGYGKTRIEGNAPRPWAIPDARAQLQELVEYWGHSGPRAKQGAARAPWFLLGHSLGALTSIDWILAGKASGGAMDFAQRAFLSAPPLKLRMEVPAWKDLLAKWVGDALPDLEIPPGFSSDDLSRDAAIGAEYRSDSYVTGTTTPRVFHSLKAAVVDAVKRPQDIEIPVCLAVGQADPIVDPAGVKSYFESLRTHKLYLEFPGAKHEIFNELERSLCYQAVASWFL